MLPEIPSVRSYALCIPYVSYSHFIQFTLLHTLTRHTKPISVLSISPDGRFLLSGCKLCFRQDFEKILTTIQSSSR